MPVQPSKIQLFPSAEFEAHDHHDENTENAMSTLARNALRILYMGWNPLWKVLVNKRLLSAILWKRDPQIMAVARTVFQEGLVNIYHQASQNTYTEDENKHIQLYIVNLLSYLPPIDLNANETIQVPQLIDNTWTLIHYHIKPIELTSARTPYYLLPKDQRVFAFGLEPINHAKSASILLFGTTSYPAGQGFGRQVLTDLMPFCTVGESLYQSGKSNINKWLEMQGDRAVNVCGGSLGGALSLLLATDQPDKVKRVDAFNPPGLFPFHHRKKIDNWKGAKQHPEVNVQMQEGDGVSELGVFKPEWMLYRVKPDPQHAGPKGAAHSINYVGQPNVEFIPLDTEKENHRLPRKCRNFFIYGLLRAVIFVLVVVPWIYIFRPIVNLFRALFERFSNRNTPTEEVSEKLRSTQISQEKTMTLGELGLYFYTQRHLLNRKAFISEVDRSSAITFSQDKRKHEVLSEIMNCDNSKLQEKITIHSNNAKLYHIEQTLHYAKRYQIKLFQENVPVEYIASCQGLRDEYKTAKLSTSSRTQ